MIINENIFNPAQQHLSTTSIIFLPGIASFTPAKSKQQSGSCKSVSVFSAGVNPQDKNCRMIALLLSVSTAS